MSEIKKVTLDELIKKALEKKKGKPETKQLSVKSLDGAIIIQKPTRDICVEALDMENATNADEHLVYECVVEPNLKDTNLRDAYGVKRPADIVWEIFEPGEVAQISKECLEFAGYGNSVKPVEEVKNS